MPSTLDKAEPMYVWCADTINRQILHCWWTKTERPAEAYYLPFGARPLEPLRVNVEVPINAPGRQCRVHRKEEGPKWHERTEFTEACGEVIAILWDRKLLKGFRERCRHELAVAKVPPSPVEERNAQLAMQNQMQAQLALQHQEHTFCTDVLDMLRMEAAHSVSSPVRNKRG